MIVRWVDIRGAGCGRHPVANAGVDKAMRGDAVAKSLAQPGADVGPEVAKWVALLHAAGVVAE
jgi:hypothetical protein